MKRYMLLTGLFAALVATAQDLSTEVVVDRTVTPVENIAQRPSSVSPAIILPEGAPATLSPMMYTGLSAVTRAFEPFAPLGGSRSAEPSAYRGYVSAAYGPLLNSDIRAGYRFGHSDRLTGGVAGAFGSQSYKSFQPKDWDRNRYADFKARGFVAWRPDDVSALDASVDARILSQATCRWDNQSAQVVNLGASWTSQAGDVAYSIGARGGFDHNDAVTQGVFDGTASGAYLFGAYTRAGIDIRGQYLHTSGCGNYAVAVSPFFGYSARDVSLRIGVGIEPSGVKNVWHNTALRIIPELRLNARAGSAVGVWVDVTGGTRMNSYETLRQFSIFLPSDFVYPNENAYLPVKADAGFNFGPFSGVSFGLSGGYASAKNWLLAAATGFAPADIKGYHAGASLSYEGSRVKGSVKADFAPRSGDSYWCGNTDMADMTVEASLDYSPLDGLTAGIGYLYRHGRSYLTAVDENGAPAMTGALGIVSDLSLHAVYNITPALSVHGELRNILGRKYLLVCGVPAQQLHGLVGATFKF